MKETWQGNVWYYNPKIRHQGSWKCVHLPPKQDTDWLTDWETTFLSATCCRLPPSLNPASGGNRDTRTLSTLIIYTWNNKGNMIVDWVWKGDEPKTLIHWWLRGLNEYTSLTHNWQRRRLMQIMDEKCDNRLNLARVRVSKSTDSLETEGWTSALVLRTTGKGDDLCK